MRQFAADGEPKTGAAILAAGRSIGLLEGFKDDLLLLERNTDTGIRHFERHHLASFVERLAVGIPAAGRRMHIEPDAALFGEFKGIRQEILEYLLQALGIGRDGAAEMRIDLYVEGEFSRLRVMAEGPCRGFDQIGEIDF